MKSLLELPINFVRSLFGGKKTSGEKEKEKPSPKKYLSQEDMEIRYRILKFPVVEITRQQYEELPAGEKVTSDFLKTCPLDTWFACKSSDLVPEATIIGQVVEGGKLLCSQYGAGLCVPPRGINRYRVKFV